MTPRLLWCSCWGGLPEPDPAQMSHLEVTGSSRLSSQCRTQESSASQEKARSRSFSDRVEGSVLCSLEFSTSFLGLHGVVSAGFFLGGGGASYPIWCRLAITWCQHDRLKKIAFSDLPAKCMGKLIPTDRTCRVSEESETDAGEKKSYWQWILGQIWHGVVMVQ